MGPGTGPDMHQKRANLDQVRSGPMAGRTVLVTGGTGGIGRATALGLAAMGAHLAITGRDRGRAEAAARDIRAAAGGQVDVFVADLSSQSEVRRLASGPHRRRLFTHIEHQEVHDEHPTVPGPS